MYASLAVSREILEVVFSPQTPQPHFLASLSARFSDISPALRQSSLARASQVALWSAGLIYPPRFLQKRLVQGQGQPTSYIPRPRSIHSWALPLVKDLSSHYVQDSVRLAQEAHRANPVVVLEVQPLVAWAIITMSACPLAPAYFTAHGATRGWRGCCRCPGL